MYREKWLVKVKSAISHKLHPTKSFRLATHSTSTKSNTLNILAFEASGMINKLLHLWRYLSDENMTPLRNHSIRLEGVRKIVSNDDVFLLGLACAELVDSLRSISNSVAQLSYNCRDPSLREFDRCVREFAETGRDLNNWGLNWRDMEARVKQMDRYVDATTTLRKEIDQLARLEADLRKAVKLSSAGREDRGKVNELQDKITWQKRQVKYQKEQSLWNRSFDSVTLTLARFVFTVIARIRLVFGIDQPPPAALPRSLSASAAVCPSSDAHTNTTSFGSKIRIHNGLGCGFFNMNSKLLKPPSSTLGTAALALHYANLIIVMEKMIRSPHLVGADARDDLYAMLPQSIRSSLRSRLKGIGFAASDPALASEWNDALGRILNWLSPLAVNMIKWQSERSFEQHNVQVQKTNVLLFQTLYFANKEKAEAAITELLVGLNYIWRFEREVKANAFCSNAQAQTTPFAPVEPPANLL